LKIWPKDTPSDDRASLTHVPQDYVQAHMWFNLAASRAPASERDEAIKMRNIAASRMTPAQIAEAQKLAREWKPKPAAQ
jgi:hypothetical protein